MTFQLEYTEKKARAGVLKTRRGDIQTPFFMSVGTRGAVKAGVSAEDLEMIESPVLLCNTYHLETRPGSSIVAKLGGLHTMMNWNKPILTDSGGFQVFSLRNRKINDEGCTFLSHIDGQKIFMRPEDSIRIQQDLGADIIMAFDECPPSKSVHSDQKSIEKQERDLYFKVRKAVERTTDWAKRCICFFQDNSQQNPPLLFGIIQGGIFADLRKKSLQEITRLPFDGFALGGLAVGETNEQMYTILDEIVCDMPDDKARYLMGVGKPNNLLEAIEAGIDMFDCVLPMRNARHGNFFTFDGSRSIRNECYKMDSKTLMEGCGCPACTKYHFSRGYLRHLILVGEVLGQRMLTLHNLWFYNFLMRESRKHIQLKNFSAWKNDFLKRFL